MPQFNNYLIYRKTKRKIFFDATIITKNCCNFTASTTQHIIIMGKTSFIVPALALLLASCGGSTQQNNGGTGTDGAGTDGAGGDDVNIVPTQQQFQYVEPEEDIAGKVFRIVATKEFDHEIYDAIKNCGNDPATCAADYSNTHSSYDIDNYYSQIDNYQHNDHVSVKCYQYKQSGWIGIVCKRLSSWAEHDMNDIADMYTVLYNDGKVTRIDSTTIFPSEMLALMPIFKRNEQSREVEWNFFNNTYIESKYSYLWNVRFNWDGEKFVTDPETPFVANLDPGQTGNFEITGVVDKPIKLRNIDPKKDLAPDGTLKSSDGSPLVQFNIEDDKITGYKILSKKLGLARYYDQLSGKPIALGYPIKNVFANNKDTSLTKTMKDGKLIVTMHVYHNQYGMHDVFYEYTAKDENSPIDGIRVYEKKFTTSIAKELDNKYKDIKDEVKEILLALNVPDKVSDAGIFKRLYGHDQHFDLTFEKYSYRFQIYPANEGGKYVLLIRDESFSGCKIETAQWWHYKDNQFTPIQIQIPKPDTDEYCALEVKDYGLEYRVGDGDEYSACDHYEYYDWDGEQFVARLE